MTNISKEDEATILRAQAAEFWLFEVLRCHGLSTTATISHVERMLSWAREEAGAKPGWVSGPFSWDAETRYPYVEEVAREVVEKLSLQD